MLFACAATAQLIERTPLHSLSPPLVSIALGAAASATSLVPTACAEYDIVWSYLMPVAAALYLLNANLSEYVVDVQLLYVHMYTTNRLRNTARPLLAAFLLGAMGTVIGTVMSFRMLGSTLGPEGSKVAAWYVP